MKSGAKKQKFSLPARFISVSLIIFFALLFVMGYIWKAVSSSGYFDIKEIITKDADPKDLSFLKGKNIFSVDLESESKVLLESYPLYSGVNLIRVLPNRIYVNFIKRKPVAFLKLREIFAIDEKGVIFYPKEAAGLELPVICGLELKIFSAKQGKRVYTKEIAFVLKLIKAITQDRNLGKYKIAKVDVGNLANIGVFLSLPLPQAQDNFKPKAVASAPGIEIKFAADNMEDKISSFSEIFGASGNDVNNIKYIDLRFREPLIKLNDAKPKAK